MKRVKITDIHYLTDSTFVLRMERNGLDFYTGQFADVKITGSSDFSLEGELLRTKQPAIT